MDLVKVKRMIGQCDEPKELSELVVACKKRQELLWQRARLKSEHEAWARIWGQKPGTRVYCHARGIFLGGSIQRGDAMEIYQVQPRAKRVWVKLRPDQPKEKQELIWLGPGALARYEIQLEPLPDTPELQLDRKGLAEVGKILSELGM
jgi:hypothetical protein